jgi:hypothetical protein
MLPRLSCCSAMFGEAAAAECCLVHVRGGWQCDSGAAVKPLLQMHSSSGEESLWQRCGFH